MLPTAVTLALPALFLVALLLLALYHTLPLIHVLPRPGPLIARLATIVPRPRLPLSRKQHLPREFFNLPPRPDTPQRGASDDGEGEEKLTVGAVLGIRGKVVMLLVSQGAVALICGWMVLAAELRIGTVAGNALAGLAVLMLPSTVLTMAAFAAMTRSVHDPPRTGLGKVVGPGGITHDTILPRIAPISTILAAAGMIGSIAAGAAGGTVIIAIGMTFASLSLAVGFTARIRNTRQKRSGAIRLASNSPERDVASSMGFGEKRVHLSDTELQGLRDTDSWIESPSRPPTPVSPFTYSPSLAQQSSSKTLLSTTTPKTKSSFTDTPQTRSAMSEWTSTPETMSSWDFHEAAGTVSPLEANQRRSMQRVSATPVTVSDGTIPRGSMTSQFTQTLTSTPGSGLRGAGGSILGGYTPNLHRPLPRAWESLASIGVDSATSPSDGTVPGGSTSPSAIAIHHAERHASRAASSRTLHSYYSAAIQDRPDTAMSLAYTTPRNQIRQSRQSHRAPPPPPMPVDMPLPPTPTVARQEMSRSSRQTLAGSEWAQTVDLESQGHWAELDDEWVDVSGDGEELGSWGRGGRGVGVLGLACVTVCTALAAPLLFTGFGDMTSTLFLASILLPTPFIVLTSYLLRPRPLPYPTQPHNLKKGSTTSVSTHQSLALKSESQLSLPATISPKLTPPLRKKPSVPIGERWGKLLNSKPSISKFGYTTANASKRQTLDLRRQTVLGAALAAQAAQERDMQAETAMKRDMHRRSADLWREAGHARPTSTRFERAREMMKPAPALCMLDAQDSPVNKRQSVLMGEGMSRRMSNMAMLSKRMSQAFATGLYGADAEKEVAEVEMSQFADGDVSMMSQRGEVQAGPSRPAIQITSPDRYEGRFSIISSANTHATDADAEEVPGRSVDGHENGEDVAIQTAKRGRMSAGPMFIYGGVRSPTSPVDATFDRPTSGQFADAESPRKRQQSLTLNTARPTRQIAPVAGPDTSLLSNPRQSASLPPHDKTSFTSLRNKLDQCGKRAHNLSIYADADEDLSRLQPEPRSAWPLVNPDSPSHAGVDLPAFPLDFAHPSFSPSSQMRTPARRAQVDDAMTARTKSLARLALTASAYYDASSPLSQAKVVRPSAPPVEQAASQQLEAPHMHGDRTRLSTDSGVQNDDSFISEASAMAHQMEDVLHMDSPTRAEFVISPQPSMASVAESNRSSWAAGRRPLSRASSTGSLLGRAASFGRSASPWDFDARVQQQQQQRLSQQLDHAYGRAPVSRQASLASIASAASGWTEASGSTYAGSGSAADFSIIGQWEVAPPVPALPPNLRRPMSQGAFSAVVHEPVVETPSTQQMLSTPEMPGTPATPARPIDARSGLMTSSIALPDPAALAALMPGQLNKRNSALLGRHPSIMDLQKEQEPQPDEAVRQAELPITPAKEAKTRAPGGHSSRSSVDTIQSATSYETDAGSYRGETRGKETPEWRMSKQDLERVQQLRERVKAGEDITRMSLTAPPAQGQHTGGIDFSRAMSDVEEADDDQFEDASDSETEDAPVSERQELAHTKPAATPPRPSRAAEAPSPAGSFAPSAYGRFANTDEARLGRVGKEVLSIEARAAGSAPPSPAKSLIKSTKASKLSSSPSMASLASVERTSPAPSPAKLKKERDEKEEEQLVSEQVPIKGLRPLRLLANRPPSIIGPSRAAHSTLVQTVMSDHTEKPRKSDEAPRRSNSFGKRSDPARRYGKPKSSIGPVLADVKKGNGKGSYASNASVFASKENLPLNGAGTPKATPKATPARRRGSKKGSAGPGVGSIRA